ncbi:MAG: hypothetical protein AMJ95_11185 [Omnitrophica WOR_2 bacterium SM23_72]|nr:MAG: hypothetical protein AMJ95_11185 [Omnitrophica WOR_2 bacterium SM23_72]
MDSTIYIKDTLKRKKVPLKPPPAELKMYVCGPTVYDEPHIGHARSAYVFDVMRRYLIYRGYKVKFVRNVTDVDDKIIEKARKEYPDEELNSAVKKIAEKYLNAYHEAMAVLNISSSEPDVIEPKATDYIDKMIEFIQKLINRGVAYASGGDVYFDIKKAKDYGKLSHQSIDQMEVGARITPGENKSDPLDFALWKAAKEGEPSWPSPWGKGRPGWHIECSVMSSDILGDKFDIHGGGIDLIFPHHENEIAQSEGLGKPFAEMAKSAGNFMTIKDFVAKYKEVDLMKLFFLSTHYSHPIDYTEEKIEEAKKAYERIEILMRKLEQRFGMRDVSEVIKGGAGFIKPFKDEFIMHMDDDFNTPRALAVLFDMVNRCNILLDSDDEFKNHKLNYAMEAIKEMANIFGLSFLKKTPMSLTDSEVEFQIIARANYKKQKNYAAADNIRKTLEEKGIILEDTKDGKTTWRKKL